MPDLVSPTPLNVKPQVTKEMILPIIRAYFHRPARNLQVIHGGNVAQTYSFSIDPDDSHSESIPGKYIIRFNARMMVNFEKEAYVFENFASTGIPIPRVLHLGRLGDLHYAITEKMPGKNLMEIPRSEYVSIIPDLIEALDGIHQVPVNQKSGYGIFDGNGDAKISGWKEYLGLVRNQEQEGDFFGKWHSLFQESFLERELFDHLYHRMLESAVEDHAERGLVHGGFGFGNVLVHEGKISAVLDWMSALYGDFLYDVAWLDFWSPMDDWKNRFDEHYQKSGRVVPFLDERILCYQCYIALVGLKFNAKRRDRSAYDFVKDRILYLTQL